MGSTQYGMLVIHLDQPDHMEIFGMFTKADLCEMRGQDDCPDVGYVSIEQLRAWANADDERRSFALGLETFIAKAHERGVTSHISYGLRPQDTLIAMMQERWYPPNWTSDQAPDDSLIAHPDPLTREQAMARYQGYEAASG